VTVETVYAIIGSLAASWSAAAFLYSKLGALSARIEALDERTKAHHRRLEQLETR
jgi:hypothetical protein